MVVMMSPDACHEDVDRVVSRMRRAGLAPFVGLTHGRYVLSCDQGDDALPDGVRGDDAVADIVTVTKQYRLGSRELRRSDTVVRLFDGTTIGGGSVVLVAGAGPIDDEDALLRTSRALRGLGVQILKADAFALGNSPYSYQGPGATALDRLARFREAIGLPLMIEVVKPADVPLVSEVADIVEVGSVNMQNFELLREVGRQARPVLIGRGQGNTVDEWLLAAEYVLCQGNDDVVLCESGIRTFEPPAKKPDIAAVAILAELTHLPIVVDLSTVALNAAAIAACARAAIAAGADGVVLGIAAALESDGKALTLAELGCLVPSLGTVAEATGRSLAGASTAQSNHE